MKRFLFFIAMLFVPIVTIPQSVTGVITGRILGTNGQPASGVRVTAVAAPPIQTVGVTTMISLAETDASGRYRLENIPPGRYLVTAGLLDLATYYPGTSAMDRATAISVTGTAVIAGIDFTMAVPTGVTVSGRLVTPSNQAVAGQVGLLPLSPTSGSTPGVMTSRVTPDGSFTFEKVRPGTYRLELGGNAAFIAQSLNLTVVDRDVTGLELVGIPTVSLTGSVVVEGGGLRPRFTISIVPFQGGRNVMSAAANTGTFTMRVAEGDYRLTWSALPAGYVLKSAMSGSTDVLREPLKVSSSGFSPSVVITLGVTSPPPWVRVSGRVRDASNGPLPPRLSLDPANSTITSLLASGAPPAILASVGDRFETTPEPDGRFEFPTVPMGAYVIRANTSAWALASVVVANKDVTGVDVVVPQTREVTGRVLIEGLSQTTPRLSFSLVDPLGNFTVPVTVQRDGTFRAVFPEGERTVTLAVPGFAVKSLNYGATDLLKSPLKIAVSDQAELQVTLAASAAAPTTGFRGGVVGGTIGGVVGGTTGGVLGGVLGGVTGAPPPPPPPPPPPQPPPPPTSAAIRVGGDVLASNCLSCPQPAYPALARAARISDTVVLTVIIAKDGSVSDVRVIRGHQLLQQAAVDAVRQWRYKPQMINGQPVEVTASVSISFTFN